MKSIIFALALVAIAAALPVEKEPVKILRTTAVQDPSGPYSYSFESEDGTSRHEEGVLKDIVDEEKNPHTVVVVKGSYTYISGEGGKPETINYYADETGFHPEGDSIPKVPVATR